MTEAVDGLLQAVLSGEWPVPASLAWALSPGSPALPAELQRRLLQRSAERDTAEEGGAPTPAAFRLAVLSRVRDQAELILAAAEAAAGPSRPGTPQHHGTHPAAGPPHPAGRGAAAAGGLEARLHRVARRLEPGAVDDLNFPTLGGCPPAKPSTLPPPAAPQGGEPQAAGALGGGGGGATPRIRPAAAAPLRAPRRAAGGGGEGESGGATPRRRIVPTQVPAVEASEPFLDTALTPQRPGARKERLSAPPGRACPEMRVLRAPRQLSRTFSNPAAPLASPRFLLRPRFFHQPRLTGRCPCSRRR
jgi:hypothetical protein